MMKLRIMTAIAFAMLLPAATFAQSEAPHDAANHAPGGGSDMSMSEGEIRKVDKEAGKLTIRHGELKNLGMPPMTMVFQVQEKALLEQVKPDDKVRFVAEKINGKLAVTHLVRKQ